MFKNVCVETYTSVKTLINSSPISIMLYSTKYTVPENRYKLLLTAAASFYKNFYEASFISI